MAWIYGKDGQRKCEVKRLSYNGVFMDVSSITVTVESPATIAFAIGDYIDWGYDGMRYTLDAAAGVEKQARSNSYGGAFVYSNLVFLSPLNAAKHADFLDVILGNTNEFLTNTEFSFYGTAWDYAKRLEANLCRLYGAGSWKVRIWTAGVCYDTTPATLDTGSWEPKLVNVSNIKCLAGFGQIYDLWGCAFVFNQVDGVNYIDFYDNFEQYAKTPGQGVLRLNSFDGLFLVDDDDKFLVVQGLEKIFSYGKGNGLYKIRRTPDADHVLVTRLRPYGSADNLPANYYLNSPDYHVAGNESSELAIANLMLPASQWTKDSVKSPANAYLEQNVALYGVREASVVWDGSDEELGEIKPTIYGVTIQDLLDLMPSGTPNRPDASIWTDTARRIDKIFSGAAPTDNGAISEAGFDFTVVESSGTLEAGSWGTDDMYQDVEFWIVDMQPKPSVAYSAEYRIVPTSTNTKAVSVDIPSTIVSSIRNVTGYITPIVGGMEATSIRCAVSEETINISSGDITYTKRYYIHLLDANGSPIVFSTMNTGTVDLSFRLHIEYEDNYAISQYEVLLNEYAVSFDLLRGNKSVDKYFSVTVPQVGFDLAAALATGAKLCMRSGANQPREFPIASARYVAASDTWYIRCKRVFDSSISTYFPNSGAVIAALDEYYFSGIAMPALYVEIAAQKLLTAATAWLDLHSKPRMLSSVDVDNKIMAQEGIVLKEGMSLPITDTDLGITPETQESRVIDNIRIEEGEESIRTFSVTLRDKKEKSALDSAIRGATSKLATNASVSQAINAAINSDQASISEVELAEGIANGSLRLVVNGTPGQDVIVKGLGNLAFKNSLAVSDIPDLSGSYLPLTGGELSGDLSIKKNAAIFSLQSVSDPTNYAFRIENNWAFGNELYMYGGYGQPCFLAVTSTASEMATLTLQPSGKKIAIGGPMYFNGVQNMSWGYSVETRTHYGLYFQSANPNSSPILFSDNGNLIVGQQTDPSTAKLYVNGSILSTGDQVLNSDATLKKNLQDLKYTVEDIAKAPAVSFDWKDKEGHSFGSIAQYWKPICPEMVHGVEGQYSLAYAQGAFTNTILLARRIVELEKQIKELKDKYGIE